MILSLGPSDRAAAKKASNRNHFDRWARDYERDRVSRWLAELQHEALDAVGLDTRDRLLDVGCGTGAAVRSASRVAASAVGVDLSPGMIERARELAADSPNTEFIEADVEALPFADASFSAALCTTSLHHYPKPDRALAEIGRVLVAGGRLVVADMTTDRLVVRAFDRLLRIAQASHVGLRSTDELRRLLIGAGFVEPVSRPLLHGCYAIVAARKRG
jgi:ubiquinone/menaquinone biosynthesis C-methylase UbiE